MVWAKSVFLCALVNDGKTEAVAYLDIFNSEVSGLELDIKRFLFPISAKFWKGLNFVEISKFYLKSLSMKVVASKKVQRFRHIYLCGLLRMYEINQKTFQRVILPPKIRQDSVTKY